MGFIQHKKIFGRLRKIAGWVAARSATTAIIAVFILASVATAGSLSPTATPAATMQTLAEIYTAITTGFNSSAITASSTGSLVQQLKYIQNQTTWASSSGNAYFLGTGSVGIGDSTPETKFEVVGTASISGATTIGSGGIISGTTKTLVINNGTSTGNIFEAQDNGTAVFTIADGGNVVLTKSASISQNFEVIGYASISSFKLPLTTGGILGDCDAAGDTLNWDATTGKFVCGSDGGGVSSDSLDFDEFVPSMVLDTNTTITGGNYALTFDHASVSSNFEVVGYASLSNSLYVYPNAGGIDITGTASFLGPAVLNNATMGQFSFDTDAGEVTWADMPVSSDATRGTAESFTARLSGNPLLTIYGLASGSGAGVYSTGVGIGDTTPEQKLTVGGNILASTSGSVDFTLKSTSNQDSIFTLRAVSTGRFDILGSASQVFMTIATSGYSTFGSSTDLTARLAVDGQLDQIQMLVQGFSTQTSDILTVENSAGTDYVRVLGTGELWAVGANGSGYSAYFLNSAQSNNGIVAGGTATAGLISSNNSVPIYFQINGATKAALNTSGYFGINTTDVDTFLEVAGTASISGNTTFGGTLTVAATASFNGPLVAGNSYLGAQLFESDAGIVSWIDMPVASISAGSVLSYTAALDGENVFTIYGIASGTYEVTNKRVGILTLSPEQALTVEGNILASTSGNVDFILRSSTTSGTIDNDAQFTIRAGSTSENLGFINGSGLRIVTIASTGVVSIPTYGDGTLSVAGGVITTSSDERLKEIDGSFDRGIAEIMLIEPILYRWNAEASGIVSSKSYAGFSAQNIRDVIPEAVAEGRNGYLSLQDRPIIAALVNATKELASRTYAFEDLLATSSAAPEFMLSEEDSTLARLARNVIAYIGNILQIYFEPGGRLRAQTLCLDDVCVTKTQLQRLLENNMLSASTPTPTPEPAPENLPPSDGPDLAPSDVPYVEPTPQPEAGQPTAETPTPTPTPEPEASPLLEVLPLVETIIPDAVPTE